MRSKVKWCECEKSSGVYAEDIVQWGIVHIMCVDCKKLVEQEEYENEWD